MSPVALMSVGIAVAQTTGSVSTAATEGAAQACAQAGNVPGNALIIGNGWRCCDGFTLGDSGHCDPVKLPPNAIVTGNQWACMAGFR